MSLATWKAKYYPVSANHVAKADAVAHSLRKWEGLSRKILKRHRIKCFDAALIEGDDKTFDIDSWSCALCVYYAKGDCRECPLAIARGGVGCCERRADESRDPYETFTLSGDSRPMVRWLKKAMKVLTLGK